MEMMRCSVYGAVSADRLVPRLLRWETRASRPDYVSSQWQKPSRVMLQKYECPRSPA